MSFESFGPAETFIGERMECGVCWRVYDPAEGDPAWGIAPATPFSEVPDDWRCPNCDAPRSRFLRLGHGR